MKVRMKGVRLGHYITVKNFAKSYLQKNWFRKNKIKKLIEPKNAESVFDWGTLEKKHWFALQSNGIRTRWFFTSSQKKKDENVNYQKESPLICEQKKVLKIKRHSLWFIFTKSACRFKGLQKHTINAFRKFVFSNSNSLICFNVSSCWVL
jgi:hypothetical protein